MERLLYILVEVAIDLFVLSPFMYMLYNASKDIAKNNGNKEANAESVNELGKGSLPANGSVKKDFSEREVGGKEENIVYFILISLGNDIKAYIEYE